MSSLFGVEAPKFVYDLGGGSEHTCNLDHISDIITDEPDNGRIMNESVVNRHREWGEDKGSHWTFTIKIELHKYADPVAKYSEIMDYEGQLVTLWRRRDGVQFKDKNGDNVLFMLDQVIPRYHPTDNYEDILTLTFLSQDTVDITKSVIS